MTGQKCETEDMFHNSEYIDLDSIKSTILEEREKTLESLTKELANVLARIQELTEHCDMFINKVIEEALKQNG